jgi:hypothetical protein
MQTPFKGRVYLDEQSSEAEYIVFFLVPASIQQAANTKTLNENPTSQKIIYNFSIDSK